ncbi:MAG: phage tail protein [Candidatus Tectimicrobiota bacterium]
MPTGDRRDPLRNFRFRLEIDGIQQAGFSEATVPDTSTDVIEYREGNETTTPRKLPGLNKYGNLSLKWGITDSLDLYAWRKQIIDGNIQRKNIAVVLIDEAGNDKARWEFVNAWPSKYDPPDLNATGNAVAIETLEVVHEGMVRVA